MVEDDRTEKQKLDYQIGKYLFNKQDAKFKKAPSRLEKASMLLGEMGLSLEIVANENPEVAGALRTLFEEKKKWFQFLNKEVRDKLYDKIYSGIADAIEKKSRESSEVVGKLESRLENNGQLFQKNPKPIDQLKTFNVALGKTQKSLFKDYFRPSSSSPESLFQSVSNAFYRSKMIRIILGFGTDKDVSVIQKQVSKINAESYGNAIQEIKTKQQRKDMDTLKIPTLKMTETPKVEFATLHTNDNGMDKKPVLVGRKAVLKWMENPKVYRATLHSAAEIKLKQDKPEINREDDGPKPETPSPSKKHPHP